MRTFLSLHLNDGATARRRPVFAAAMAAVLCWSGATSAQEGDLASSAGVFIEPARKRATAPRERRAPQRAAPRRTKPKAPPTPPSTSAPTPGRPAGGRAPAVTAESLNARAESAIDAGRFGDAVEPLSQALKLKPDFADAHY